MNFVRTSHYPPSERFLHFCDRFGIYVESETAVCFVDTYRQKNYGLPGRTQDSAEFAPRYLSQCREMVKAFRFASVRPVLVDWKRECVRKEFSGLLGLGESDGYDALGHFQLSRFGGREEADI